MFTLKICAIKIVTIDTVPLLRAIEYRGKQLHRQRSSEKKTALRMEGTKEEYGRWGGKVQEYF